VIKLSKKLFFKIFYPIDEILIEIEYNRKLLKSITKNTLLELKKD